jgi:hypothetical protein
MDATEINNHPGTTNSKRKAKGAQETLPMAEPETPAVEVAESELVASEPASEVTASEATSEIVADEAGAEPVTQEAAEVADTPANQRKRIEEQLEALKRRESELRRELAMSDHPELVDALRELEGHAYAVTRVEAKMAQGLTKSEERKRETLEKKLASAREKHAEIAAHIAELEAELSPLGPERTRAFESERLGCLKQLLATMGTHEGSFQAKGLDTTLLVPELARLLPEIRALAESLRTR